MPNHPTVEGERPAPLDSKITGRSGAKLVWRSDVHRCFEFPLVALPREPLN